MFQFCFSMLCICIFVWPPLPACLWCSGAEGMPGNIRGICGDLRESRAPGARGEPVLGHLIGHQVSLWVSNGDVSKMCYTMGSHLGFQSPHRNITIAIVLARYLQTDGCWYDRYFHPDLQCSNQYSLCIAGSDHRQLCYVTITRINPRVHRR